MESISTYLVLIIRDYQTTVRQPGYATGAKLA